MGFSRFHLCDLQVHTPADARQGYGDAGGREPNRAFADRLVQAHAGAGVTVLAVSDHNRVDWYPVLREAGDAVGVFVFPALEFSVNRCHLLAIWDRTDAGFGLARQFLASLWKPGESPFDTNGDPRPVGSGQVLDLAQRAVDHRALVLAPHATAKDIGIFAKGVCTNRGDVLRSGLIAGYDVWGAVGADVLKNPAAEFGETRPTWFISGDTRSFADVGKRAVYLKLGDEPTLEGIRQAFLVPETRIRFPSTLRDRWDHVVAARFIDSVAPSWSRIVSTKIVGGFHDTLDVEFGPGLNAIIGGKGTGKSTLIEILRYALHAKDVASNEAQGNRSHNFRANAEATIAFVEESGDTYEVRRTGSADPARLLRDGVDLNVDVSRRVAIRVFGQRELQALADRSDVLREFVATEAGTEWEGALARERGLLGTLKDFDAELDGIERQLAKLDDDEHELADLTDRITNATAKGASGAIARLSALGNAQSQVSAALEWPKRVRTAIGQLAAVLPVPEVPEVPNDHEVLGSALASLGATVGAAAEVVSDAIEATEATLLAVAAKWEAQRDAERMDIERQLADAGLTDPREFGRLQTRARELQTALADLPEKRRRADQIEQQRATALTELGEVRRLKSRLVEAAARTLNDRVGHRVRIRVDPLADKEGFRRALENAVKGQSVRGEQLRSLAADHTPFSVAAAIRAGQATVEGLGCTAATASKLCDLEPNAVRVLEETDTPDQILVEVNLGGDGDGAWHEVSTVSPGQRATALLALALAGGREPLVIDQPEDDLDNRYIYDEVVQVLAEVCQSRQVIVATHNANIPILGDAEFVLALDAEPSQGKVLACGGLEDASVAEWSRKILEGGEAAFQARHRRYQAARP